MRSIRKTHQPEELKQWLKDNKDLDCCYGALRGKPAHTALKEKLLKEQHYLCAYTGRRISINSSHCEHLKPQNKCVGTEDVSYKNIVACFPKDGGDESYGYGAPIKKGQWNPALFLSPCSSNAERKYRFSWSGKINPTNSSDKQAIYTIDLLKLDHPELSKLRKSAIKGFFGFNKPGKELTKKQAHILLRKIDTPTSNGQLRPFCFILKQLLNKYAC